MIHTPLRHRTLGVLALCSSMLAACSGGDDAGNPFVAVDAMDMAEMGEDSPKKEPLPRTDSDGDGRLDLLEVLNETDPFSEDEACTANEYTVRPNVEPGRADFVFIVDTSGSMREELPLLKQGIIEYFTPLLEQGALDFTVTVIGRAQALGADFCLPSGFDDQSCQSGLFPPINQRFAIYDAEVHSSNSLELLADTMHTPDSWGRLPRGWSGRLRPGAMPVFIELSDDDAYTSREAFEKRMRSVDRDNQLYAEGELGRHKYVWHSIIGIASPRNGLHYNPEDPFIRDSCSSAPNAGLVYQELSKRTGGLRFPVCESVNYAALLDEVAAPIVEGAAIPCAFNLPRADELDRYTDSNTLGIQLRLGNRPAELLERQGTVFQCTDRGYYLERLSGAQYVIRLCPDTCELIQREDDAALLISSGCYQGDCSGSITHGSCD